LAHAHNTLDQLARGKNSTLAQIKVKDEIMRPKPHYSKNIFGNGCSVICRNQEFSPSGSKLFFILSTDKYVVN
jgi:hypothetical protein